MDIVRMQVEGGFLDGFDVRFDNGLNVLIGARGTGKTSVIELLRYALGARNVTAEAERRSLDHARAILGDGQVTVTVGDDTGETVIIRSAADDEPQFAKSYVTPLILSQTEIETLGLNATSRLRLLDGFVPDRADIAAQEAVAVSAVRSAFKEVQALEGEISNLSDGLDDFEQLREATSLIEARLAAHHDATGEVSKKQERLAALGKEISVASVREAVLERFELRARSWSEKLRDMSADDFGSEGWEPDQGVDPLTGLRDEYADAVRSVDALTGRFSRIEGEAATRRSLIRQKRIELETLARSLRSEIEHSVEGLGSLSRELSQKKTRLAQLDAKQRHVRERQQRLDALRKKRNELIIALQNVRKHRFFERDAVARRITKALSPSIKIEVEQYGQYGDYVAAITEALRGSGLKYTELANTLSQQVSPLELVEFTDKTDFLALSEITGIPKDRAARLLGHLREAGTSEIAVAPIHDNVRMSLLDGVDYKPIEELSAGQRCTIVLSLVLQHRHRTLVIDQPEDHLDNAFIATTVIRSLRIRKEDGQVILSTHNANIPVLGEAGLVIELASDGRNGFVQVCAPLEDSQAVESITSVMEGGKAAFQERAEFYDQHGL